MAHAETKGWAACPCCGGKVAWKANRSGLAYCRCDHCGVEIRHHWHKTSDKVLSQFAPSEEKPDPAENRRESLPPAPGKSVFSSILDM